MEEIYTLPVLGAAGLVFGGNEKDTLFVITESSILDSLSATFVREIENRGSIYAIKNVDARGLPSVRMNIKHMEN